MTAHQSSTPLFLSLSLSTANSDQVHRARQANCVDRKRFTVAFSSMAIHRSLSSLSPVTAQVSIRSTHARKEDPNQACFFLLLLLFLSFFPTFHHSAPVPQFPIRTIIFILFCMVPFPGTASAELVPSPPPFKDRDPTTATATPRD